MRLGLVALLCSVTTLAVAQDRPAPKWELFGGYSFFHPGADVHGVLPGGLAPVSSRLEPNPRGAGASVTYNFNRWFGLTLDGSTHWGSGESTLERKVDDAAFSNLSFGPKITFRSTHFSPFLEALVGDHRLMPDAFHDIDKLGFMAGGGLDVNVSKHVALRLLRADYVMSSYRYGPSTNTPKTDVRGVRLQAGVVFLFGGGGEQAPASVAASCSAQPNEVMVGEPITVNASASNFNLNHTLTYSWSTTGGKVSSNNSSATIDTNGLTSGSYTATARVTDPKARKNNEASCRTSFTVKELPKNPPTISCSASPAMVQTGTPSTISCTCTSPDNASVTVGDWTASGGSISGSGGSNATLNTSGASAGPIKVSATCTDARGLKTTASTQVNVDVPPPAPPQSTRLSQCDFPNEKKPWRVDNTCKAILDDVAKNLQQNPDNKLVIVGNAESSETRKNLAGERAVNSKNYLATGEAKQGIDPSRIETRTGPAGTKTAEYWVVPAGASFGGQGVAVDESKVKAVPDHPAPAKKGAKRKAQ
jgi:outer membrane protein OmpA-like peptidoglycan-associated protein